MRKQQAYLPLQEALSFYSDQGWTIHVFPWVVGIRGMIDPSHVHALLKFLELPNRHWHLAVDRTVLASVRAFSFLHKVRFGGLPETVLPDLDPDHSEEDSDDAGRVSGSSGNRTGVQLMRFRTLRTRTPRRMLMVLARGLSRGKNLACPCPTKEWACRPLTRQPCPPQLGLQTI